MNEVQIEKESVSASAIISVNDIATYTDQVFRMYNSPMVDITEEFKDKLDVVLQDECGEETKVIRMEVDRCVVSLKVQASLVS